MNWTNLRAFHIAGNSLSGTLPESIGDWWPNLDSFILDLENNFNILDQQSPYRYSPYSSFNNFSGTLPVSIGNWNATVQRFSIFNNSFTGQLPDSIGNWGDNLVGMGIGSNKFNSTLPESIQEWTNVQYFDCSDNAFSGTIPNVVWESILVATLHENDFSGTLPSGLCSEVPLSILTYDCDLECACCPEEDCSF